MTHYFSRITLTEEGLKHRIRNMSADSYDVHREVWDLFPGMPDSNREFVYSVMDDGRTIYMVSTNKPLYNAYMSVESKEYDPTLHQFDVFRFRLLANPTVMRSIDGKRIRHDVVMDLKTKLRTEGKQLGMNEIMNTAVSDWLVRKAGLNGFEVDKESLMIHSYSRNESRKGRNKIVISTVIIEGTLMVKDVETFRHALFNGIGSAKGFGCGMLMIKRT